jgi:mitosis inhibitor protein kinase SWE1
MLMGHTDWQLPPPRIPPRMSPLKSSIPSHLASNASDRTASSSSEASSTATTTMLASPTTRRLRSQAQGERQHRRGNSGHEMRVSIGSVSGLETYAQPGRFEREFVEIGEVGSGEFGKVMKVRRQNDLSGTTSIGTGPSGDISAVKKSKQFEGVRHR